MQAFIKDKQARELVINSQILDNEKTDLVNFVNEAAEKGVNVVKLYDVLGNVSGVKFVVK